MVLPVAALKDRDLRITSIDPRQDYMTVGALGNIGTLDGTELSSLSNTDDIMARYGTKLYDEMMKDPKVNKCINLLKISILGDGVELLPSVGENHPDYDMAVEIAGFCSKALKELNSPLRTTLEQMLDALIYGNKVAEVTYQLKQFDEDKVGLDGKPNKNYGKTWLVPRSIKVKPFNVVRFIVDTTLEVIGFTGFTTKSYVRDKIKIKEPLRINASQIVERDEGIFINIAGQEEKFLNREKFMLLTIRAVDEDPRGNSILRSAFNPYHLKSQVYPEYLRYLLICAIPLIVGFTPENDGNSIEIQRNADGTPVLDSEGRMVRVNPVAALRGALLEARNASALALKGGSKIEEIGNNGNNGVAFQKAVEVFNEEIEQALLLQNLASSDGKYNTRAASQTHMTILDQLVWWYKGIVSDMLTHDLLRVIIKHNFGESFYRFMPKISLGDTERRDFSLDAAAVSALFAAGYINQDQLPYFDALIGAPVRDKNYNQFKDISPNEALQISKAVLDLEKLRSDVDKQKKDALASTVDQLTKLRALASGGIVKNADGTTSEAAAPEYGAKATELINSILERALETEKTDDPNNILQMLLNAGKTAQEITGRPMSDPLKGTGDSNRTPNLNITDTNEMVPNPSGGTPTRGNYIPKNAKPVQLSRWDRVIDALFGKHEEVENEDSSS